MLCVRLEGVTTAELTAVMKMSSTRWIECDKVVKCCHQVMLTNMSPLRLAEFREVCLVPKATKLECN